VKNSLAPKVLIVDDLKDNHLAVKLVLKKIINTLF